MYVCMYVYIYVCVYMHTQLPCIYAHICVCIYTCIHTNKQNVNKQLCISLFAYIYRAIHAKKHMNESIN